MPSRTKIPQLGGATKLGGGEGVSPPIAGANPEQGQNSWTLAGQTFQCHHITEGPSSCYRVVTPTIEVVNLEVKDGQLRN